MRQKEKDNVFGQGSRTPVAVILLVKNPDAVGPCTVRYHDIGDYLTREKKLFSIEEFGSIENIPWQTIEPDASGDWINQRNADFLSFAPMGDKKDSSSGAIFDTYSLGVVNRPGFPGGSKPWEGWSHGRKETPLIEAVPA
jgi:predicted helicase